MGYKERIERTWIEGKQYEFEGKASPSHGRKALKTQNWEEIRLTRIIIQKAAILFA